MNTRLIKLLFASVTGWLLTASPMLTQSLTHDLIEFNSDRGELLLVESGAREDYFPLTMNFVTQDNLAYCGVASIVMVLNALGLEADPDSRYGDYTYVTQVNFWDNPDTHNVIKPEAVARGGMTLSQLSQLLAAYPVEVEVYHAQDSSLEQFRQVVVDNLQQEDNYVLVNYLRREIGQERGGHISPIAAYHEDSDRFLILDVSRYKYPPVWVSAEDLWRAMNTVDSTSGQTRGFVLVSGL